MNIVDRDPIFDMRSPGVACHGALAVLADPIVRLPAGGHRQPRVGRLRRVQRAAKPFAPLSAYFLCRVFLALLPPL
jgi:hypothetical protein